MLHDIFCFLLSQSLEAKRSNLLAVQQKLLYQRSGWLICFMIVFGFFVIPVLGGKALQLTCSAAEASVPEIWMAYMLHDSFRFLLSQSLEAKRSNLRAVQQKLANLQAQFTENNNKKKQLEVDVDMCSKKLDR